jgi:hypothetical protein
MTNNGRIERRKSIRIKNDTPALAEKRNRVVIQDNRKNNSNRNMIRRVDTETVTTNDVEASLAYSASNNGAWRHKNIFDYTSKNNKTSYIARQKGIGTYNTTIKTGTTHFLAIAPAPSSILPLQESNFRTQSTTLETKTSVGISQNRSIHVSQPVSVVDQTAPTASLISTVPPSSSKVIPSSSVFSSHTTKPSGSEDRPTSGILTAISAMKETANSNSHVTCRSPY